MRYLNKTTVNIETRSNINAPAATSKRCAQSSKKFVGSVNGILVGCVVACVVGIKEFVEFDVMAVIQEFVEFDVVAAIEEFVKFDVFSIV